MIYRLLGVAVSDQIMRIQSPRCQGKGIVSFIISEMLIVRGRNFLWAG